MEHYPVVVICDVLFAIVTKVSRHYTSIIKKKYPATTPCLFMPAQFVRANPSSLHLAASSSPFGGRAEKKP